MIFQLCNSVASYLTGHLHELLQKDINKFVVAIKNSGEYFIFISDPAGTVEFQLPNPQFTGDAIHIKTRVVGSSSSKLFSH